MKCIVFFVWAHLLDSLDATCDLLKNEMNRARWSPQDKQPNMYYFAIIYVQHSGVLSLLSSFGRSYTATYKYPFLYSPHDPDNPYELDGDSKICAWGQTRVHKFTTTVETIQVQEVASRLQLLGQVGGKSSTRYTIERKSSTRFMYFDAETKTQVPYQCSDKNLQVVDNTVSQCEYKGISFKNTQVEERAMEKLFHDFELTFFNIEGVIETIETRVMETIGTREQSQTPIPCRESITNLPSQQTASTNVYFIMNGFTARYAFPPTIGYPDGIVGKQFTCDSDCTSSILRKRKDAIDSMGNTIDIIDPENFKLVFNSKVSFYLFDVHEESTAEHELYYDTNQYANQETQVEQALTALNADHRSFGYIMEQTEHSMRRRPDPITPTPLEEYLIKVNYDISYSTSEFRLSEMPPATTEQILKASARQIFLPILLLTEYNEQMFQVASTPKLVSHISVYPTSNSIKELMGLLIDECPDICRKSIGCVCNKYFNGIKNSKLKFQRFLWPELSEFVKKRVLFLENLLDTRNDDELKLYGGKGILESGREILGQEKNEFIKQVFGLKNVIFYTSSKTGAQTNSHFSRDDRRLIKYESSFAMFEPILETTFFNINSDDANKFQLVKRVLITYFVLKHILASSSNLLSTNLQIHYSIFLLKIYTLFILPYRRGRPIRNAFSEKVFHFLQQFELVHLNSGRRSRFSNEKNIIEFMGQLFSEYKVFEDPKAFGDKRLSGEFKLITLAQDMGLGNYDYSSNEEVHYNNVKIKNLIEKQPYAEIPDSMLVQYRELYLSTKEGRGISFLFGPGWSFEDWNTWKEICNPKSVFWDDKDDYQVYACDEFISVNAIVGGTLYDLLENLKRYEYEDEESPSINRIVAKLQKLQTLVEQGEEEFSKFSSAYNYLVRPDAILLRSMYSPTPSSSKRISQSFKVKKNRKITLKEANEGDQGQPISGN